MKKDFSSKIDHFGIVVKNIKESADFYQKLFGLKRETEIIKDPIQKVYVQFFTTEQGEKIELVEPISKESPSYNALIKGGGANHICFQVKNIQEELIKLKKMNCIIVCPPTKGAGFNNAEVAFVVHPLLGLIELVEYQNSN